MALKAGRVGVAPDQVDPYGKVNGGGGSYVLPVASAETLGGVKIGDGISVVEGVLNLLKAGASQLGGVKVGNGLSIDADGVLSASGGSYVLPVASAETLGGVKIGDGISVVEGVLNLLKAGASQLGGVKVGNGLSIDADGVLSVSGVSFSPTYVNAQTPLSAFDDGDFVIAGSYVNGAFHLGISIKHVWENNRVTGFGIVLDGTAVISVYTKAGNVANAWSLLGTIQLTTT